MTPSVAAVSTLAIKHLARRQAIIGISAHFFAAIRHVFVATAALVRLAAAAQR